MTPRVEAQYEDLRNQWLGEPGQTTGRLGMALLLRDGLASWMQVWRDRTKPESCIERVLGDHAPRSGGNQAELVMALANMAFSAGKEIGI